MNSTIQPNPNTGVPADFPGTRRGWVFYDGICPVCVGIVARLGGLFRARGFEFVPLQESWIAPALGVSPTELRREMKLRRRDGVVLGGANAWRELGRSIWWLWPFVAVAAWPGFRWIADRAYRWVAEHRYCLGDVCNSGKARPNRIHHTTGFLELP